MRTIAVLAAAVAVVLALDPATHTQREVNGDPVPSASKYPWMTSLLASGSYSGNEYSTCGGSLIAPTWVLTAAHCIDTGTKDLGSGFPPGQVVAVGSLTPTVAATTKRSKVLLPFAHPDFEHVVKRHDLALLKLATPIEGVQAVNLATADYPDLPVGAKVWSIGWGILYDGGPDPAALMEVKLPIVSRDDCRRLNKKPGILNSTLCTGYAEGGRDSCQGDSGGPLVHVGKNGSVVQVGLTSWGVGCARSGKPGVWTRISDHRQWIESTMAAVDSGAKVCGCPTANIGNGYCNMLCYNEACQWDGGDCNKTKCSAGCTVEMLANNVCDAQCASSACGYDNSACHGLCASNCLTSMINDTHCDAACMTSACSYDGGDCAAQMCAPKCNPKWLGDGYCDADCYTAECNYDKGDCVRYNTSCALFCPSFYVKDGRCDPACNVKECNFDGGDCDKYAQCGAPLKTLGDGKCNRLYNTSECLYDGGDCLFACAPLCNAALLGNTKCDPQCYTEACKWDNGKCAKLVGNDTCAVGCLKSMINNYKCDEACYNSACNWDGYDCDSSTCNHLNCLKSHINDGVCQPDCVHGSCQFDGGDCFDTAPEKQCAPGCYPEWHLNNGQCDPECINAACGYDAADCNRLFGCSPYCLDSWIHDGECDPECNTHNCSWDGGDCPAASSAHSSKTASSSDESSRNVSVVLREVNGDPVSTASKYPWMTCTLFSPLLSLRSRTLMWTTGRGEEVSMCGGTLIAPTWVLTAAHCVHTADKELDSGFPPGKLVAVGSLTPAKLATAKTARVLLPIAHPDFDHHHGLHNDVALLKLADAIEGVQSVKLAASDYPDLAAGAKVWSIGWGILYDGGTDPASLMEVKLPIVSRDDCRRLNKKPALPNSTLCTMYAEGGRDSCQGDSGGPLVHVGSNGSVVQVGLTSWGVGCARSGKPGVWTRISEFHQWIESTMAAVDGGAKVCGCPHKNIDNGHCNMLCYTEACQWDGGDCNDTMCSEGCTPEMLANDVCDVQCASSECYRDNFACGGICADHCLRSMVNDTHCDAACLTSACSYDGSDCVSQFCSPLCPPALLGNDKCNPECYNAKCNYDGGDCAAYNSSCALLCEDRQVKDGHCDPECNVKECRSDGGDCDKYSKCSAPLGRLGDGHCDRLYNTSECQHDGGDCLFLCAPECSATLASNDVCDPACYNAACKWDGGMCAGAVGNDTCSVGCRKAQVVDGVCDAACFNLKCHWDGTDCDGDENSCNDGDCITQWIGDGVCQTECAVGSCRFDGGDCFDTAPEKQCAPGCYPEWHLNNGQCDPECINAACGYDAADCQALFGCSPYCVKSWIHDGECDPGCGAALIAPTWVLTAAHCVDHGSDSLTHGCSPGYLVAAGTLTPRNASTGQRRTIVRAITHPGFDLRVLHNDVALLKIDRPITGLPLARIATADYPDLQAGAKVWGIGWGFTFENGLFPFTLMETKLPIVSRADCGRLDNLPDIGESMLCTGFNEGGRDTCQGDSGGPLLHLEEDGTYVQVGITSFGPGCARPQKPGIYTRVSEFRQWIDSTMAAVDRGDKVCNCPMNQIGNGYCNILCYSEACQWDGGDCNRSCSAGCTPEMLANDVCDVQCATNACGLDNNLCKDVCADNCLSSMVDNKVCDRSCLNAMCSFDGDDCPSQYCSPKCPLTLVRNKECNPGCYNANCSYDGGDCAAYNNSCALFCLSRDLHNGVCDPACNVKECNFDGGDCDKYSSCHAPLDALGNGRCSKRYNTSECLYDGGDCLFCAPRCSLSMINNSQCDSACHNAQCNWDGGMCEGQVGEHFCSVGCNSSHVGNGVCDEACFTSACKWDRGDCIMNTCNDGKCLRKWAADGYCQPECAGAASCGFEGGDCFDLRTSVQCAPGCLPVIHRNNSVCDPACMNSACGYDAPDCQSLVGCAPLCLKSWIHDGQCDTVQHVELLVGWRRLLPCGRVKFVGSVK
eukprot:m51a1_g14336 putative transmembrane protease serine 11g-like (1957) ;mRNA; r:141011-151085